MAFSSQWFIICAVLVCSCSAQETLERVVEVNMVIEQEYKESYSDPVSDEYKQIVGNFIKKMTDYYRDKKVPNLEEVKVTDIRPGPPQRRTRTVRSLEVVNVSKEVIKPRAEGCQEGDSTCCLGENCQPPIENTAFYVGLSVTLLCLLVIVAALIVRLATNRNKQTKEKDMKVKLVNEWLNEEFQWTRSKSPAGATNTAFSSEDPGESSRPDSLYQMTRPFSVNTSSPPQAESPFPYRGMSPFSPADQAPNQSMRINRPQIRGSWEA